MSRSIKDFGFAQNDGFIDEDQEFRPKKKFSGRVALLSLVVVGGFLLQTTLAANINLTSNGPVEFGQGIQVTTACSGSTSLVITPNSSFVNASGAGAFYFSSIRVSNIPSTCYGVDFSISAYGETATAPLALFNSTFSSAVVYNNAGTFERGAGIAGMTVSSSSGAFTVNFTNPVATSGSVFRITLQSGAHTAPAVYNVGDTGPGGGVIYYISNAGFNCGATFSATGSSSGDLCHYLEVAPNGWSGSSDPTQQWAVNANLNASVSGIPDEGSVYNNGLAIGLGYKNSLAIIAQGNDATSAAGAARAYAGGSKSDWYLPTAAELNLLCQWDRGVTSDVTTVCSGGSRNSATFGASAAGFVNSYYWSSSELSSGAAWAQYFADGAQVSGNKNAYPVYVRPIRAF